MYYVYSVDFKKDSSICNKYMNSQIALRVSKYHGVMALLKWEPRLQAPLATGRPGVSSAGTGRPHQIWSFSYGPGGWACCLDTRSMGGWPSILFFCPGRAGGRRDFVVENRVGVGGRPGTPGPVGGPGMRWRPRRGGNSPIRLFRGSVSSVTCDEDSYSRVPPQM